MQFLFIITTSHGSQLYSLFYLTAFLAALSLALLARSVALLPFDRTWDARLRERSEFSLLSLKTAWLPVVLACAVAGLQLSFWEHATVFTGEMLDLLPIGNIGHHNMSFTTCTGDLIGGCAKGFFAARREDY